MARTRPPLLRQVKVPTLILVPTRSPITPLSDQLTMPRLIPNARIAVIEGPGHEIYHLSFLSVIIGV